MVESTLNLVSNAISRIKFEFSYTKIWQIAQDYSEFPAGKISAVLPLYLPIFPAIQGFIFFPNQPNSITTSKHIKVVLNLGQKSSKYNSFLENNQPIPKLEISYQGWNFIF